MKNYEFDRSRFSFRKVHRTVWNIVRTVVSLVLTSAAVALVTYFILSLFINTDTEKRLARENNMYEKVYGQMLEREQLIGDAVAAMEYKDNQIYREIFNADAPSTDPESDITFAASSDTLPHNELVEFSAGKLDGLLDSATEVEQRLRALQDRFMDSKDSLPPLSIPLKTMSYAQVGATVGDKVNPFYKVPVAHNGLDIIAPQGDPV